MSKHKSFFDYPPSTMLIVPNQDVDNTGLYQGGKGSFFRKIGHVLAPVVKAVSPYVKQVGRDIKSIGHQVLSEALNSGKSALQNQIVSHYGASPENIAEMIPEAAMAAAGKKRRRVSEKTKKRHDLVRKLMREKGMTLPEASSYIKKHNLV
jgi:hypothetical protein